MKENILESHNKALSFILKNGYSYDKNEMTDFFNILTTNLDFAQNSICEYLYSKLKEYEVAYLDTNLPKGGKAKKSKSKI